MNTTLIPLKEAARRLCLTTVAVRKLVRQGKIRTHRYAGETFLYEEDVEKLT
jgi:excisionase family DNA binding protein